MTRIGPSRSPSARDALDEQADPVEPAQASFGAKRKPSGHRLGPALELLLGGEPVARRVQLDRVEPLA